MNCLEHSICISLVWTRNKIEFDLISIFFWVCNKPPNWHFKNQAHIDIALARLLFFWTHFMSINICLCWNLVRFWSIKKTPWKVGYFRKSLEQKISIYQCFQYLIQTFGCCRTRPRRHLYWFSMSFPKSFASILYVL